MTHDELVKKAVSWLKGRGGCGVAVPELVTWLVEQPDAVGWRANGAICIVIECKLSRGDFLKDKRKFFRAEPGEGAGNNRYYLTPAGLLDPYELPENWGLLEIHGRRVKKIKESGDFEIADNNFKSEAMLYSLLRRCEIRGFVRRCLSKKWAKAT